MPGRAQEALDPTESRISRWVAESATDGSVWSGETELGYLQTHGNSVTQSIQFRGRVQNERPHWRHTVRADAVRAKEEGTVVTARYQFLQKSALKLSARDYLFELLRYERDRFQDTDYRLSEVVGYGRRVADTQSLTLDLETGPGARQTRTVSEDRQRREAILVLIAELRWSATRSTTLTQDLSIDIGEVNTVTRSLSGLTVQASNRLSLKVSLEARHNTHVPEGVDHTDTTSAVTLVYSF